jgi:hypothetical protein
MTTRDAWEDRCATVAELLARDARWCAWLSARRQAGLAVPPLDGRGTGTRDPNQVAAELGAALQDVRRRRLCLARPEGWPVLKLEERARLTLLAARFKATAARESVTIRGPDVQRLGHALAALLELLDIDWAEAVGVQERLVAGFEPDELEKVDQLERLTLARLLANQAEQAARAVAGDE